MHPMPTDEEIAELHALRRAVQRRDEEREMRRRYEEDPVTYGWYRDRYNQQQEGK